MVADAPERIDRVDAGADRLDGRPGPAALAQRSPNRSSAAAARRLRRPAERLAGSFEYDRRALLGSLGQTARGVLQRHDHQREATQLAASVRDAVTQATLLEAGAVGLGAVSMATRRQRRGRRHRALRRERAGRGRVCGCCRASAARPRPQFRTRTEELRARLMTALRDEFQRELERSMQRIRDALAPYDRFVRSERERTDTLRHRAARGARGVAALRTRVERLAQADPAPADSLA